MKRISNLFYLLKPFTLVVAILSLTISSCTKESVFTPDPANNALPLYSESGKDIAGAMFNDTVWISKLANSCLFCSSVLLTISSSISGDSTSFYFMRGDLSGVAYSSVLLTVVVKSFKIETQDSIIKLNNKTFLLDGINNYCGFLRNGLDTGYNGTGSFIVKKIQKQSLTIGDGSPGNPIYHSFIISGVFNFDIITNNGQYKISDGRYDFLQDIPVYIQQ